MLGRMRGKGKRHARCRAGGFTLIELLIALAILSVVAAIALPSYTRYRDRVAVAQATSDIIGMHVALQRYIDDNRNPPDDLTRIGAAGKRDPWGQPYVYLNLKTAGIAKARKNKNLVPINSRYDLYSKGKDGASTPPLTAANSRDDVILANDGAFVGKASEYE